MGLRQLQAAHSLPDHVRLAPVPTGGLPVTTARDGVKPNFSQIGTHRLSGLEGGQSQHIAPGLQPGAQVRHAGGGHVLKLADRLVPLPEDGDGLRGPLRRKAAEFREGVLQGRADEFDEGALRRHRLPSLSKAYRRLLRMPSLESVSVPSKSKKI